MQSALHIAFIDLRYTLIRSDQPEQTDILIAALNKALALVGRVAHDAPINVLTFFAGEALEQHVIRFERQEHGFVGQDLIAGAEFGSVRFGIAWEPRSHPWRLMDAAGQEAARLEHVSGRSPATGFLARWLPERFQLMSPGLSGLTLRRAAGFRDYRLELDLKNDPMRRLDRRLALGAAALLALFDLKTASGLTALHL